ncbi:MAG: carbohydrate ABC transporter permease [Oscillospiraceae bacterium]|nr:carbohydrate ABC transporter permease [Oscillospiraceae bacterium]
MGKKRYIGRTILFLLAAVFAVGFLMPTVLTLSNSFMAQSEIDSNYGMVFRDARQSSGNAYVSDSVNLKLIPDKVSFIQYIVVLFRSPDYILKLWNSIILVLPIVIAQVGIASFAAYSFSRYQSRFKNVIFFSYIILMLMPYQVTTVPNYLVANWTGLINTRWAVIFPGAFAPFSVFLLTKFMRRIPVSLIEAAKLDGASEWQIFTGVCLPQCRSALYSIVILVFIDYWNMVELPIIMLNEADKQPLSVYLSVINAGEVGVAFAIAVVYMIPPLLLFLHGEEALVEGITHSGSVKG